MQFTTVELEKTDNAIVISTPIFNFTIPYVEGVIKEAKIKKTDSDVNIEPTFVRWIGSFFSNLDVFKAIPEGKYVMQVETTVVQKYRWNTPSIVYKKPITGSVVLISLENSKAYNVYIRTTRNKPRKVKLIKGLNSSYSNSIRVKIFDISCRINYTTIHFLGHDEKVVGANYFIKDGKEYFRLFYGAGAGEIVVPWDTVHLLLASVRLQRNDGSKFKVYL